MLPFKLHRDSINFHKVLIQDTSFDGRAKDFMTHKITNVAIEDAKFQHIDMRPCLLDALNDVNPYTHIRHYFLVQANPDSLSDNQLSKLQFALSQATGIKNIVKITCNFYYNAAFHPDNKAPPNILDRIATNGSQKLSLLPIKQISKLPDSIDEESGLVKHSGETIIHTSQQEILDDIMRFEGKVYDDKEAEKLLI
jgi:hypothetical protein